MNQENPWGTGAFPLQVRRSSRVPENVLPQSGATKDHPEGSSSRSASDEPRVEKKEISRAAFLVADALPRSCHRSPSPGVSVVESKSSRLLSHQGLPPPVDHGSDGRRLAGTRSSPTPKGVTLVTRLVAMRKRREVSLRTSQQDQLRRLKRLTSSRSDHARWTRSRVCEALRAVPGADHPSWQPDSQAGGRAPRTSRHRRDGRSALMSSVLRSPCRHR